MASDTGGELERIRELRQRGLSPKEIARAVGLPPARVTQLIKKIAMAEPADPTQRAVVECWVSTGWSTGLTVVGRPDWWEEPVADDAGSGLAGVLVARDAGRDQAAGAFGGGRQLRLHHRGSRMTCPEAAAGR